MTDEGSTVNNRAPVGFVTTCRACGETMPSGEVARHGAEHRAQGTQAARSGGAPYFTRTDRELRYTLHLSKRSRYIGGELRRQLLEDHELLLDVLANVTEAPR